MDRRDNILCDEFMARIEEREAAKQELGRVSDIVKEFNNKIIADYYASTPIDHVLKKHLISRFQSITNERNDWTSLVFDYIGSDTRKQVVARMRDRIPGTVQEPYRMLYFITVNDDRYTELHRVAGDVWDRVK